MSHPSRRLAALALLAGICSGGWPAGAAQARATSPVRVSASFDPGARLGSASAMAVDLRLDPSRLTTAQLTEVRVAYPQNLGLVSSGLGLATCTRPAEDFAQVLISGPTLGGCPPNSVMGYGEARAIVRLVDGGQVIPEYATVALLSGPIQRGLLGLVVFIDGQRPFGAKLAFSGQVTDAAPPYGGALRVRLPAIPGIADLATVSLVELRVVIGSHAIRYYERRGSRVVAYRPDGVELPAVCPPGGFRFRADVRFADGSRRSATSVTRCPPPLAAATPGR
ncbi:MAG TPA: hypothetical protein VFU94_00195 [Conexibacter sp.]|nr:hypothetical protein [Conexibacter sp.]